QLAQVVAAGVLDQAAAQLQQLAAPRHQLQASDPVAGVAVADHADAAGIGGDVTADGAGAARAEVHRVLQSVSARSLPYGLQHGAGLHRECAINWIEARSEERRVGKECRSRWSA